MKKIFFHTLILLFSCAAFYACDDTNTSQNNTETVTTTIVPDTSTQFAKGRNIFKKTCITCHQVNGKGVVGTYPPLAQSDFLLANKQRAIQQVLQGSNTAITVNGNTFNSLMPPQELSDSEIADVLNYVYHTWGNKGFTVTADEVKAKRTSEKGK